MSRFAIEMERTHLDKLRAGLAENLGSLPKAERELKRLEVAYGNVDFVGKRVLDIGGGRGTVSYYASVRGAAEIICLEPASDGSEEGLGAKAVQLREMMGTNTVRFVPLPLQDYLPEEGSFDVVIMRNSINHIDEVSCERLPRDPIAVATYLEVFRKVADLTTPGGLLLASDVSPSNLFNRLGIRNPFAPTIEWQKHQIPDTWILMMAAAGFQDFCVRWLQEVRLGPQVGLLTSNRIGTWLTSSYFIIQTQRSL